MAVTQSRWLVSSATRQAASDFYQRHPDWTWEINDQDAVIPLTGDSAFPDHFQRHPELNIPLERSIDTTDYFSRRIDKNTSSRVIPLSAEQIHPEYIFAERFGTKSQSVPQQTLKSHRTKECL
jgi:hypothetical protein